MKKLAVIFLIACTAGAYGLYSCSPPAQAPEKNISLSLITRVDSFAGLCNTFHRALEKNAGQDSLRNLFLGLRISYKSFEWAAEYFEPLTARVVNGPPVVEVENSGQVNEPSGLQVIEGLLYPAWTSAGKQSLNRQLDILTAAAARYQNHFRNIPVMDWQVFDAAKLEVFRIMTLGISGFDNPLTLHSTLECAESLSALREVLNNYGAHNAVGAAIDASLQFLNRNPDFNLFNRAEFITGYCNPLTIAIGSQSDSLKIKMIRYNRLLNQDAQTLFDSNAFNVNAFAPDHSSFISEKKIVLGKKLFADPVLSGNGVRSCQSCHQPDKFFTDGVAKNTIIDNHQFLERNTPTLLNAALQPALFSDLRVNTLEDQSLTVVQSSKEMHGSMVLSVNKLWRDTVYRNMFLAAFPYESKTSIDTFEIMNALGSYIRSLTYLNSRFDEYMRGNRQAMNTNEVNGFNLFMGKAKCGTCHYMPLFNGAFPPRYVKIESEVIGVPETPQNKKLDQDPGRYTVFKHKSFLHAFKIPTIRNASRTAPYMHNGVFGTLDQVMNFYNQGGGAGFGFNLDNQTLPADKLQLTKQEVKDIVSFIGALDSHLP